MAALSTGVGSLRDVFKQDGPLAAGTGECGVATENDGDRVTVKEKQDPVQPRSQTPAGQSYKVADSISHLIGATQGPLRTAKDRHSAETPLFPLDRSGE